jgi:DNA-binding NarL/FixJ family response regulator
MSRRIRDESFKKFAEKDHSRREKAILELLQSHVDGLTRRQVAKELKLSINCVTSPVLALIRKEAVIEAGTRFDAETNRNVAVLFVAPEGYQGGL